MIFRNFSYIIWEIRFNPIELIYAKSMSEIKIIEFIGFREAYTIFLFNSNQPMVVCRSQTTHTQAEWNEWCISHSHLNPDANRLDRYSFLFSFCFSLWVCVREWFFLVYIFLPIDRTMNELLKSLAFTLPSRCTQRWAKSILSFILYLSHVSNNWKVLFWLGNWLCSFCQHYFATCSRLSRTPLSFCSIHLLQYLHSAKFVITCII